MEERVNPSQSELRLRALVHAIPDLIWLKDTNGVYLLCNTRFEQFFGAPESAIVGKTDYDFVDRELADSFRQNDLIAMHKGGPSRNEEWVTFASDGHRELLETTKTPLLDEQGVIIGILGIGHDISERSRNQEALAESEARFRTMFDLSLNPVVLHQNGKMLLANAAAVQMFGADSAQQLLDTPMWDLIHPDFHAIVRERIQAASERGIASPLIDEKYIRFDGTVIDVEVQNQPIVLSGKAAVLVTLRDITEHKALDARMHQMAFFDPLTSLPNRRMLGERLNLAMSASKRSGLHCALLFIDLDHFKPLNDTHGHDVGDLLLMEVAGRLTQCLRAVDTVARFGGDEFVVLLQELDANAALASDQAAGVAEKIRLSLGTPFSLQVVRQENVVQCIEHHGSCSIGAVVFTNHEASNTDIMKWADVAMYQAKDAGRNTTRFHRWS